MERNDFCKGQKLETPIWHKEEWPGCTSYVVVTSVHATEDIVHYSLDLTPCIGAGRLCSGMRFNEAKEYKTI